MLRRATSGAPIPFVKWAGGKRQLLPEILARAPARIDTYVEPFVGGGAVFFALARERRFRRAVLADANEELVETYRAIRDDVDGVIALLREHREAHARDGERHFYTVRDHEPDARAARAARLVYLNRTGFNGLYRVNSKGLFNVPFGRHVNPGICDETRLRAAAQALADVDLRAGDFADPCRDARPGDFVYLDPPYVPLSKTASFTAYARAPFGPQEQARLAGELVALAGRGVAALLSNSDCDETRRLYRHRSLAIDEVAASRAINSVVSRRGAVGELLVSTKSQRASRARAAESQAV